MAVFWVAAIGVIGAAVIAVAAIVRFVLLAADAGLVAIDSARMITMPSEKYFEKKYFER